MLTIDSGFIWPVKILIQLQHLSLSEVLLVQSIYHILVVALEVPSGMFSDRLGRKPTLVIAALAAVASLVLFSLASTFLGFLLAYVVWSIMISFTSGTDSSFHYDSLEALGLEAEFQAREASILRALRLLNSACAVVGGFVGIYGYGYAFLLSAAASSVALMSALRMTEPPRRHAAVEVALALHFKESLGYLREPVIRWFFGFAVLSVILDYMVYQYYQPYMDLLRTEGLLASLPSTSVATGVHVAITMTICAFAVGMTPRLLKSFSAVSLLLAGSWIHFAMLGLMAAVLHPLVAVLIVFREIPNGLKGGVVAPLLLPRVEQSRRATVLSLMNFNARLFLAASYFGLSLIVHESFRKQMSFQLSAIAAACFLLWIRLAVRRPDLAKTP